MRLEKKIIILPLLALVLAGCTPSRNPKRKGSSIEGTSSGTSQTSKAGQSSQSTQASQSSKSASGTSLPPDPSIDKTELLYDYDDYQSNNAYGLDNCPLTGSPKLLIVPIWFTDSNNFISSSKKESVRSDIEKAYIGTNEETGWRSVKTFYEEESLGEVSLRATVSEWYSVSNTSSYYGNDSDNTRTNSLVESATSWYFTNHTSESRKDYDSNNDGFIDGVMLIYAAADNRANESAGGNLWAYCYWLDTDANVNNPNPKTFFWASYDFMYGSNNAYSRSGQSSYAGGDCSYCNIDAHTFIHEMGHVFGLEDYYDYYESTQYCPGGAFSMQDWNMGGHDPYSVMAYGWADPYIPTQTATINLRDFQSSHDVILLANHSVNSPFDEYLLIEFYTPTGLNKFDSDHPYSEYDRGPTQSGIRLWHVDGRLVYVTGIEHSWQGDDYSWSNEFITDPTYSGTEYGIYHGLANSYGGDYASVKGSSYYNFNILQLIRNDEGETYRPSSQMNNDDLFVQGDSFNMAKYGSQFYRTGKMNTNEALGWSFTVDSISSSQATITVTKA